MHARLRSAAARILRKPSSRDQRGNAARKWSPSFQQLEPRVVLAGDLLITEFMASNDSTLVDEDDATSDWVEIFNNSESDVNLDGWHLTDNALNLEKWEFPAVTLSPDESLVVFASNKDRTDPGVSCTQTSGFPRTASIWRSSSPTDRRFLTSTRRPMPSNSLISLTVSIKEPPMSLWSKTATQRPRWFLPMTRLARRGPRLDLTTRRGPMERPAWDSTKALITAR